MAKRSSDELMGNDETVVHLEKINESINKRLKVVREEEEKMQKEKDMMNAAISKNNVEDDDVIEINVGGETVISAKRSTLCLAEGSMFSNMFSGRWDDSLTRDKEGRVFLDEDPDLIKVIVNFLRKKKRENPEKPFRITPKIPDGKKEDFDFLLDYYGLTTFVLGEHATSIGQNGVQDIYSSIRAARIPLPGQEPGPSFTFGSRPTNGSGFTFPSGRTYAVDADYWRCRMCSVQNLNSRNVCQACSNSRS